VTDTHTGPGRDAAVVLRAGLALDGGARPVGREVWIAGGRVVEPGSASIAHEVDLGDRCVVCGLIDAHVHLCLDEGPDVLAAFRAAQPPALAALARTHAARTVAAGTTLVRDLGAPTAMIVALRDAIARGVTEGPRLLASGAPITTPDGHVHEMGGAVRGIDAAVGAVRARRLAGVDLIKVMATGGGSSPQTDPRACQFDDAEMTAIVAEARRKGVAVACHAHADAGIRQAVAAGAATIEHGSYASEASLRAMAEQGIALVPTLSPAVAILGESLPAASRAAIVDRLEARRAAVRSAARLGVRIVAGTDAGVRLTAHGSVAGEVIALASCGLPIEMALAAAWREAAIALGRTDLGTLAPGARADLLVLEDDPRRDLRVLGRPLAVMLGGRWIRPPALSP
jgi:imidazolonepropionase-like amidohydrolase